MDAQESLVDLINATKEQLDALTSNELASFKDLLSPLAEQLEQIYQQAQQKENELKEAQLVMESKLKEVEVSMSIFKENFEAREKQISLQAKGLEDRTKELAAREASLSKAEQAGQSQVANTNTSEVNEKLARLEALEKKMEANSSKINDVVHLNVGGKRYSLLKKDLLKHNGTYLAALVSSDHSQQLGNGEVFVDRSGKLFSHIVKFIKTGKVNFPRELDARKELEQEFEFFQLPFVPVPASPGGTPILSNSQNIPSTIGVPGFHNRVTKGMLLPDQQQAILSWLPNRQFFLRYKASTDSYEADSFHRLVDGRACTLTIIRTNQGHVFGGYSSVPFDSSWPSGYKYGADCFIYTLTNPYGIPPTKFPLKADTKQAIWCSNSDLASFGKGDIHIASNSNSNTSSYISFPVAYVDQVGKGNATFTGGKYFTTDDIEVYSVEAL